jgi:hypothetical protein
MSDIEKAPLAEIHVSAGDELTLADLEYLHGQENAFETAELSGTLELSQDLQGSSPADLELAATYQSIELPVAPASDAPVSAPDPSEFQPSDLLLSVGSELFDLSRKDDIAWAEEQFQTLFSQVLYPSFQRLGRIWNSESEVSALYQQIEDLSRQRAPVEDIMEVAHQVSKYRELSDKERLSSDEARQASTRLALLQDILTRYQRLFQSLH